VIPGIRVVPKDDVLRKLLKHPANGVGFRPEGGIEWPNDRFTQRRLRDGDVMLEPEGAQEEPAPQEEEGRRRRFRRDESSE
jgi:hypothetical protein